MRFWNDEKEDQKKSARNSIRDGVAKAVILDIDEYQEMLERLEDAEDLKMLENMRKTPLQFRSLDEFLKEYNPSV